MTQGQMEMDFSPAIPTSLAGDVDRVIRRYDHCRNTGDCDTCELHDLPYKDCRWTIMGDAVTILKKLKGDNAP